MEVAESNDARNKAEDGTKGRVTRATMADCFVADTVFLLGVGQGNEGRRLQVGNGTRQVVEGAGADPKCYIPEAEESIQSIVGGGPRYSPGRSMKKKPRTRLSAAARAAGVASWCARATT